MRPREGGGYEIIAGHRRQRGYTRSISGLYRFLRKSGQMAVKLPNPKYIPKPYEQMSYPGQRVQIDVKYVPKNCLVGAAAEQGGYYQYTFLDEYSRFRYLEAFQEHSTFGSMFGSMINERDKHDFLPRQLCHANLRKRGYHFLPNSGIMRKTNRGKSDGYNRTKRMLS